MCLETKFAGLLLFTDLIIILTISNLRKLCSYHRSVLQLFLCNKWVYTWLLVFLLHLCTSIWAILCEPKAWNPWRRERRQSDCVCKRQSRVNYDRRKPPQTLLAKKKKNPKHGYACLGVKSSASHTTLSQGCLYFTLICPMLLPDCATFKIRNVLYLQCILIDSSNPLVNQSCYSTFKHRHTSILLQTGIQSHFFSIQGGFKIFFPDSHSLLIDLPLPLAQESVSR